MSENQDTFLCGGVLFFMLMKATFPDGSARDHREGSKDEHKAPDVMSDLVYTFTGSWSYRSEKDTSNYRECKTEGTVNVPFDDESVINAYDDTVQNRYHEALNRMCEFTRQHVNPAMKEWLVRALLEVIDYDRGVKDGDVMYILREGSCVTKGTIRGMDTFELEPFLVGVLHYVLVHRHGLNHEGQSTLDLYGDKKPYKERVHKGNAGQRITRGIMVELYEPQEDCETRETVDSAEEKIEEEGIPECETVYESESPEDKKITFIRQQTNVIQHGENNFNLTNNGVMNFDFGGGKK